MNKLGYGEPDTAAVSVSHVAIIIISAYIAAQMLADIASLKIGLVLNLSVDMGTFIYPVTFTLRDMVHKRLGKQAARTVIVTAGAVNLLMSLYLMLSAAAASDPSWGLGQEFRAIMSPMWRIVLASIAAEVISELVDTEIYHWFVQKITKKHQWLRVLISNSFSVPIDNVIFAFGAFAFTLSWNSVAQIFLFNLAVKYTVTLVSLPLIYLVREAKPSYTDNETKL